MIPSLVTDVEGEEESGEILWQSKGIWDRDRRPLKIGEKDVKP